MGRQRDSKHSPFLFLASVFIAEHLWSLGVSCPGFSLPNSCAASVRKPEKALIVQPQLKPHCVFSTALVTDPNQSTRQAALKEMKSIPAKPSTLWSATASGGGSLCQLFGLGLWRCFLKVVFAFLCFKANVDHCAIQFVSWFSPSVSTELIHEKHCAVSLLLGDHCHFLFN